MLRWNSTDESADKVWQKESEGKTTGSRQDYYRELQRNLCGNGEENEDKEENCLMELTVNYAHQSHIWLHVRHLHCQITPSATKVFHLKYFSNIWWLWGLN